MNDFQTPQRQADLRRIHLEQALREMPPSDSLGAKILGTIALIAFVAAMLLSQFL
jgi:hypothetical protein